MEINLPDKNSFFKSKMFVSALIFVVMFAIIFAAAFFKYYFYIKLRETTLYLIIALCYAAVLSSLYIYFIHSRKGLVLRLKDVAAICACMTLSFIFSIYISIISIFLMPLALSAFLTAPIARRRDTFICNMITGLLVTVTVVVENSYAYTPESDAMLIMMGISLFAGAVVAYAVSSNAKRVNYILKGFLIGIVCGGLLLLIDFMYLNPKQLHLDAGYIAIAAAFQVIVGLLFQPLLEFAFNLTTSSRLVELTDHSSPLISRLLAEAPGTFNHCLAVANFAEVCAAAIGESPYLARACAYYHDIGKLTNKAYFAENQSDHNPHDDILPEVSAEIIRGHTTEGLRLCEKHRIPYEISHVTIQHHGTLLIPAIYEKAKKLTDSEVDPYEYSYHGVTPRTKVAAIIMICDSGEAAIRAMDKPDGERVNNLLKDLISARIAAGQFDQCDISLKELNTIRETMVAAYGGLYHKRLKYPGGTK